ncbi:MAG: PAS domain S-box protein, partial [Porticoccaceae bacterium]
MSKTGVRELDIRYWLPLLGVVVLVAATSAWMWLDYSARVRDSRETSLAEWRNNMATIRRILDAGQNQARAYNDVVGLFNDAPGLNHLAVIDGSGLIRQASQPELQGRPATAAFQNIDAARLDPARWAPRSGTMALESDAHIRGYFPLAARAQSDGSSATATDLLYLDVDTSYASERILRSLYIQTVYFALFSLSSLLGLLIFIRRFVSGPIAEITRGVQHYSPGATTSIRLQGRGPLNRLAQGFNRLSEDLSTNFEALHRREQRLDRILHSIGDAVIIVDTESRVERLNPIAEALTGWPRAEAIGRPVNDVFRLTHYLSGDAMANPVLHAMETGETQQLANHAVLTRRDGHQYHIADSAAPIRGADHAIDGGVLVFHDVSEAYRVREERRIAAIAFDTGAPQLIADGTGKVIRANQAASDVSGYTQEEFLSFQLTGDIFIGQDSPGLGDFLAGKSDLDTWTGHTWWRTKTGELMQIWVVDTAIRNEAGAINYYVISALDITQLVQTTATLEEARGNYRHLIESIHDGVAIIENLTIVECNQQFAHMLGRDRGEIVGHSVPELSLPRQADGSDSDAKALDILQQEVLATGDGHIDWSMVHACGRRIDIEASLSRIAWEGKPAILATTRDITERRLGEQEWQTLTAELARKEEIIRLASNAYGIASW